MELIEQAENRVLLRVNERLKIDNMLKKNYSLTNQVRRRWSAMLYASSQITQALDKLADKEGREG
jgi:hypothetical protein